MGRDVCLRGREVRALQDLVHVRLLAANCNQSISQGNGPPISGQCYRLS